MNEQETKPAPIKTSRDGVKYRDVDQSGWPVVSNEKYADMLAQVAAGLLASGHYSNPDNVDSETRSVISRRNFVGHFTPVVVESAAGVVNEILTVANLRRPDVTEDWEWVHEDEQ